MTGQYLHCDTFAPHQRDFNISISLIIHLKTIQQLLYLPLMKVLQSTHTTSVVHGEGHVVLKCDTYQILFTLSH